MTISAGGDGFFVGDFGWRGDELDVGVGLEFLEDDAEVEFAQAANDGLFGGADAFDDEAGVFGHELVAGVGELCFVGVVLEFDGEAVHGIGKRERLEADVVEVVAVVEDTVEVDFFDLGDGGDFAGPHFCDFDVVFALELKEVADANGLFLIVDQDVGLGSEGALVDAEDAELADKGVGVDFHDVGDEAAAGVRFGDVVFFFLALVIFADEFDGVDFERAGAEAGEDVEHVFDACTGTSGAEEDGDEVGLLKGFFECAVELGWVEAFALFEVLLGEVVIDFDDLLDDGLVGIVDG